MKNNKTIKSVVKGMGTKMKVVILAAGIGTRIQPLTKEIPKCLIKINDKTILERIVENCLAHEMNDFIAVVGHGKGFVFEEFKKLEEKYPIKSEHVENEEYKDTNTGVSLCKALEDMKDSDVVVINGDMVFDRAILGKLLKQNKTSIVVDNVKKLTNESFKVVIDDGIIRLTGKDVPEVDANGEFIGISLIKNEDLNIVRKALRQIINKNKKQYYDFAFQELSKTKKVSFVFTNGLNWTEVDTTTDLEDAKNLINASI